MQMNEIILLILHVADHGPPGRPIVEAAWMDIIKAAVDNAVRLARSPFEEVAAKIRYLGLRFYPDENVFPLRKFG